MRSLFRTAFPGRCLPAEGRDPLVRNAAAMALAAFVVGLSFGAISAAAGLPALLAMGMSMLVFAGGSQFMAVGIVASGGSAIAAVLAGLLLNARHLPFGLALADTIGRSWPARLVGSHILVDETVAFTLAQEDERTKRRAYWLAGAALFVAWNAGTLVGAAGGQFIGDPGTLGVDAAFPAGMLALLLPSLRERRALVGAVAGGAIALAATPVLPAGLPVLVALLGLALALPVPAKAEANR
jgi:4-azaleucine resistance transporter AzlC